MDRLDSGRSVCRSRRARIRRRVSRAKSKAGSVAALQSACGARWASSSRRSPALHRDRRLDSGASSVRRPDNTPVLQVRPYRRSSRKFHHRAPGSQGCARLRTSAAVGKMKKKVCRQESRERHTPSANAVDVRGERGDRRRLRKQVQPSGLTGASVDRLCPAGVVSRRKTLLLRLFTSHPRTLRRPQNQMRVAGQSTVRPGPQRAR